MRGFLSAACAGFVAGYAAVRAAQAVADVAAPRPALAKDAPAYGRFRRATTLSGLARSLATSAAYAFFVADRLPERLRGEGGLLDVAGYYALSSLAEAVLETPVDYIERFVAERRYGMSDQTGRAWIVDRAKGAAVALAIGTVLVTTVVAATRRFPRRWPVLASLGIPPLLVLANLFVPVYIAPLFNTFEPIEGELEVRLRALAHRYGVGDAKILRYDMSRQTKKANAYVTGLFRTHRIVVADTLIEGFAPEQIEFVVAHELGHYVGRDTWIAVTMGSVAATSLVLAAHALARRDEDPVRTLPALQRFTFYLTVLSTFAGPLLAAGSRAIERRADRFAVAATGRPDWGIAAFERLRDLNLAEDEQPRWAEILFSSHPSLKSRIATLRSA